MTTSRQAGLSTLPSLTWYVTLEAPVLADHARARRSFSDDAARLHLCRGESRHVGRGEASPFVARERERVHDRAGQVSRIQRSIRPGGHLLPRRCACAGAAWDRTARVLAVPGLPEAGAREHEDEVRGGHGRDARAPAPPPSRARSPRAGPLPCRSARTRRSMRLFGIRIDANGSLTRSDVFDSDATVPVRRSPLSNQTTIGGRESGRAWASGAGEAAGDNVDGDGDGEGDGTGAPAGPSARSEAPATQAGREHRRVTNHVSSPQVRQRRWPHHWPRA